MHLGTRIVWQWNVALVLGIHILQPAIWRRVLHLKPPNVWQWWSRTLILGSMLILKHVHSKPILDLKPTLNSTITYLGNSKTWQWYIILILGSQCTTNYAYVFVLASTMTWKNSYLETNTKPKTNSIYHNHTCERFTNITVTHHIDFRLTMHDKFHIVLVLGYVLDWRKA